MPCANVVDHGLLPKKNQPRLPMEDGAVCYQVGDATRQRSLTRFGEGIVYARRDILRNVLFPKV